MWYQVILTDHSAKLWYMYEKFIMNSCSCRRRHNRSIPDLSEAIELFSSVVRVRSVVRQLQEKCIDRILRKWLIFRFFFRLRVTIGHQCLVLSNNVNMHKVETELAFCGVGKKTARFVYKGNILEASLFMVYMNHKKTIEYIFYIVPSYPIPYHPNLVSQTK